ncbi:zinc ribbon domain-containing protein [Lentilactobacillus parabuchneri]|uniref:zinc ribbon domain-containing protein n=1 Tax=Lentilactobacillus parabuchneri TaxID=152331 RepID=UPI0021A5B652|nr:zinc-ribbon domain-containing protein [Lentilactobacillus parabuchneri]
MESNDSQDVQFCPNCGHKVTATEEFCPNCGYNLAAYRQGSGQGNATQPQAPTSKKKGFSRSKKKQRTKKQKRRRRLIWLAAILVIILGGTIAYGAHYYSKASTLNRVVAAVKKNQIVVRRYFFTKDPNLKINDQSLQPLIKYFHNNPEDLAAFQTQMKTLGTYTDNRLAFKQNGRQFLLFPKYEVEVKPVYVTLSVNKKNAKLQKDGQLITTSTKPHFTKKIGPLVPGTYDLSSSAEINGHKLSNDNNYHLHTNGQLIPLTLKTVSFTVHGPQGTTVMINSKDQGKIGTSGTLAFKDFPWTQSIKVQGVYQTGKTSINSQSRVVGDNHDNQDITLPFKGLVSYDDADTLLTNLCDATASLSNNGDIADATDDDDDDLSSFFTNGDDDSNYHQFVKMGKGYYNDDDIMGTDMSESIDSIKLSSDNSSDVTFDLKYRFDNGDHYHYQIFRYTATLTKGNSDDDSDLTISYLSGAQKVDDYDKDYD